MGTGREGGVVTWRLGRANGQARTSDAGSRVEGNVEITLVGTNRGGGGFDGFGLDGRGISAGGAFGIRVLTSNRDCLLVGLVQAPDPGSARRLGGLVMVLVTLVGVERPWRIFVAKISGNSDRSIAPGCSNAGWRPTINFHISTNSVSILEL